MTNLIDPATGKSMRTEQHDAKLEMLFEWLAQNEVLRAILEHRVAAPEDLVSLTALLSVTISTPGAGLPPAEGVTEANAGEFMFLLLSEPSVLRAIAEHASRTYGLALGKAKQELRAMHRELKAEQPKAPKPKPKLEIVH